MPVPEQSAVKASSAEGIVPAVPPAGHRLRRLRVCDLRIAARGVRAQCRLDILGQCLMIRTTFAVWRGWAVFRHERAIHHSIHHPLGAPTGAVALTFFR